MVRPIEERKGVVVEHKHLTRYNNRWSVEDFNLKVKTPSATLRKRDSVVTAREGRKCRPRRVRLKNFFKKKRRLTTTRKACLSEFRIERQQVVEVDYPHSKNKLLAARATQDCTGKKGNWQPALKRKTRCQARR